MLSPAAMDIEAATDTLKEIPEFIQESQIKELVSAMGAATLEKLGSTFPLTEDFKKGYILGLQTARVIIACSPAVILKGVNPKDVL